MISAVIPTLNSQESLTRCFESLLSAAMSGLLREVIVADGGSTDDTLAIADAAGAHIVDAKGSRGALLAAGALTARGDWLLFLHPETALESRWDDEILSFIQRSSLERPCAAAFRFGAEGPKSKRIEAGAALRCWLLGLPYGEQGLLIPARFYRKLGGYRPLETMEDVDLVRRIGRGRLAMLRSRAFANAPGEGARNLSVPLLYALRLPTPVLARLGG